MSDTSKQMKAIMERIKNKRESLGLSFQQLADLTQLSKSTLQRYETGGIKNIPLDKLEVLAKALQTTPEWILGWNRDMDELDKTVYRLYPNFRPDENYISDYHLTVSAVTEMEQKIKNMIEDTTTPWIDRTDIDSDIKILINNYQKLTNDGQKKLLDYSKDLVSSGNYSKMVTVVEAARTPDNRKSIRTTQMTEEELSIFDTAPQSDDDL